MGAPGRIIAWLKRTLTVENTQIGHTLRNRGTATWLAVAVAVATVAVDVWLFSTSTRDPCDLPRVATGVLAGFVVFVLCRGNRTALGLTLDLSPWYSYWIKALLLIVGAYVVHFSWTLHGLALGDLGVYYTYDALPPEYTPAYWFWVSGIVPVYEELIYRLVLCVPLVALAGPRVTIVLGGTVSAGLHFLYGGLAPDYFVFGCIFAWLYLKSGSIAPPIMLHSLHNSVVMAYQVLTWYLIQ